MRIEAVSDLVEEGITEDGEKIIREVSYLMATDSSGYRWVGKPVGYTREDPEYIAKQVEIAERAYQYHGFDVTAEWTPWFPMYGSDAYVESGQEAAYAYMERKDERYAPASMMF